MASWIARSKSRTGARKPVTMASAATLSIPDGNDVFLMTGTTKVDLLRASKLPGREITFIGTDGTGNAFENVNATTTEGEMDLGGSDITVAANDVLKLTQLTNGAWIRSGAADN